MAKMSFERIEQMIRDFEEKNRMSGHAACTHPDSTKSPKLSRIPSGVRASALLAVALLAVLVLAPRAPAQTPELPVTHELVVGTKIAPPFAMKAEDGTWRGISIDLWRRVADQLHLRYRFQETTLEGLTEGVAKGSPERVNDFETADVSI
jgi:hypothetical protein